MTLQTMHFYAFGPFRLDSEKRVLVRDGTPVPLTPKATEILLVLVEHAGHMVDKDDLMKRVWPDAFVEEGNLNKNIFLLRKLLGEWEGGREYIETVPKRGYRFVAPVSEVTHAEGAAQQRSAPATNLTGKKVSHYRVLEILGGGGMGVVYKAEDLKLGRRVALKFLPEELGNDASAAERFEREARAASSLDHPNICSIYEFGEHEGQPFLVMQLLEGQTLRERIDEGGPLPTGTLLDIAIQIAQGLDWAHQKGIIHRDIKPTNIFITGRGEAKILDFGLAKLVPAVTGACTVPGQDHRDDEALGTPPATPPATGPDLHLSRTGVAMGTAGYMSPEQVRGEKLDARTDLFSFGLVLYEMATGQRAFASDTVQGLHEALLKQAPPPARELNPELPSKLEEIIDRALEKDRESRYQSAAAMLADLRPLNDSARSAAAVLPLPRSAVRRPRWPLFALGSVVVLAAVSLVVHFYLRHRQASRLTEQDTLVLTDFANSTGDAIFDDTLKQALNVALRQSPFLNILPDRQVGATLKLMTRPANTPLTPEIAREVCQRVGSKAYILGAIGALGSEYVLGLKAVNCQSGEVLAQQQGTAPAKDKVLEALGNAAAKLRGALGESLATVREFDVPLNQATTPSLEALKEYSLGSKAGAAKGPAAELTYNLRAIQLDPNFAIAYLAAGKNYYNMSEIGLAAKYFSKAFQLRDRAGERESQEIAGAYYYAVTGELDKAAQTYEKIIESYPRTASAYNTLSVVYAAQGQYEKAADMERQLLRLNPGLGVAYQNLTQDLRSLQRFNEAEQTLQTALARKLDTSGLHKEVYTLAFLEGNSAAMAEQLAWFESKPEYENLGLSLQSDTEAYVGHQRKARELAQQALDSSLRADSKESAAMGRVNDALRETVFGNAGQARQAAAEALKLAPMSQYVEIGAALAFAMAGDTARAASLTRDLGQRLPLDTQLQSIWLPTIDAASSLVRKKPADAIVRLTPATLAEYGYSVYGLYPTYVRGQAYLAGGQGSAAAGEFQKILDHNGIVLNCPTGALAHLGVARANTLEARTDQGVTADAARARALAAYRDFFALWKDADPDIPILKEAKAEYAKVQ